MLQPGARLWRGSKKWSEVEVTEQTGIKPWHSVRLHAAHLTDIWNFIVILSVVSVPRIPQLHLKGFKLLQNVHQFLKYGFELNQFQVGFIIYYIKIDIQTEK